MNGKKDADLQGDFSHACLMDTLQRQHHLLALQEQVLSSKKSSIRGNGVRLSDTQRKQLFPCGARVDADTNAYVFGDQVYYTEKAFLPPSQAEDQELVHCSLDGDEEDTTTLEKVPEECVKFENLTKNGKLRDTVQASPGEFIVDPLHLGDRYFLKIYVPSATVVELFTQKDGADDTELCAELCEPREGGYWLSKDIEIREGSVQFCIRYFRCFGKKSEEDKPRRKRQRREIEPEMSRLRRLYIISSVNLHTEYVV
eukprot:CAMPEP_0203777022 /NCGR_PEP_ID=MMETSP0099_2-20121227/7122_1 /ASSEMBLY_ACC=CAM_ASM_000209 /TAXON_ID=96639 /ORGANISM=" , Strain NY0313808BC1" /LENGTH=255 /DNA_ID=CAMNT_0050676197 /DNA_START=251 /DNA_END=1015 /DNA_ORIENTATION=+